MIETRFDDLPFGIPCSAAALPYVFCRVRNSLKGQMIFIMGEGVFKHITEITTLDRTDFFEVE